MALVNKATTKTIIVAAVATALGMAVLAPLFGEWYGKLRAKIG